MSSRRGGGNSFAGGNNSKGKNVLDQLTQGVGGINLSTQQNAGDNWEVIARKNKGGNSSATPWGTQQVQAGAWGSSNTNQRPAAWGSGQGRGGNNGQGRGVANAWSQPADPKLAGGRGQVRPQGTNTLDNYIDPQPRIPPPLEHGWNWQARPGVNRQRLNWADADDESIGTFHHDDIGAYHDDSLVPDEDDEAAAEEDDDSDIIDDSDDDLASDDYDSEASQKSHDTLKQGKWFKRFFDSLDKLTIEQINEPERQWHCPACQNGPGSIDWYCLQPLMAHAKTKGSRRTKLHRELAELLEEELRRRGTTVRPAGEVYGKWKGLEEVKDHFIVWPPMVIVMNTKLEMDDDEKWKGMGNQELLDYFSSYGAERARHSYGPQGHRGMSVLIFEASANGYIEAERLHKHFIKEGTDRDAWDGKRRALFYPGGKRQLYGYMAIKKDVLLFNQHSQAGGGLKFEMKSHKEMVLDPLRKMSEDNQQLNWFKSKYVKQQKYNRALKESLDIVSDRLRKTAEENRIVRLKTKSQYEQNKEEMDFQENFFQEQLERMYEERNAKEEDFEKLQQELRQNAKKSIAGPSKKDEVSKFIHLQEKEMEVFVDRRDKLMDKHENRLVAMRKKHRDEELQVEKEFNDEYAALMNEFKPSQG